MIATIWPTPMASAAGRGDVGVDVADRDGDAGGQAGDGRGLLGQRAGGGAELADGRVELVVDEAGEVGVELGQEGRRRVGAVLVDALVAGGAGVADIGAAELPHDPVGGLDEVVHRGIDGRGLLEHLQTLGELPLRGDQAAVAAQPRLVALAGQLVDAVGLRLRGVVLPELDVGVRLGGVLGDLAQRGAVGGRRQDRAGGEVGGDADDPVGVDARIGQRGGHRRAEHLDVVGRHLERPVGPSRTTDPARSAGSARSRTACG